MIKVDIVNEVSKIADITKVKAEVAVDAVFDAMRTSMQRGERIELRGFGVFQVKPRKRGIGRNPRTGKEVRIPPGRTIRFKPGKDFRTSDNRRVDPARLDEMFPAPDDRVDRLTPQVGWQRPPKFKDRVWLHVLLLVLTIGSTTLVGLSLYLSFISDFSSTPPQGSYAGRAAPAPWPVVQRTGHRHPGLPRARTLLRVPLL